MVFLLLPRGGADFFSCFVIFSNSASMAQGRGVEQRVVNAVPLLGLRPGGFCEGSTVPVDSSWLIAKSR
jgi:hypothetical protein